MSTGELLNTYNDYFKNFTGRPYGVGPGPRLAAAQSLIDPSPDIEQPDFSQGGHRFLVAHWGEDLADLKRIAVTMYARKGEANRAYATESDRRHAIAITEGSSDMVLNDDPELSGPVTLEMGRVATDAPLYNQFGGTLTTFGKDYRGVPRPFLNFRQSLLVTDYETLQLTPDGEVRVTPYRRDIDESFEKAVKVVGGNLDKAVGEAEPEEYLPKLVAYMGTVSLAGDRQLYQRTKNLVERELIFGNTAAFDFIKALAQKASLRSRLAFAALERSGAAVSGQPLPKLANVFGKLASVNEPFVHSEV